MTVAIATDVLRQRAHVAEVLEDVARMGLVRDEVDRSRRKAVVEFKAARAKLAEAEANAIAKGVRL